MISHVSIKDFAIIKDLSLDLYPGLNVITGETGSGKSVIIEAISMALGSRADSDFIRTGADKASITIIADTPSEEVTALLTELEVPADMPMVLHREISAQRSLCRVNGSIVPLSVLSKICRHVADIHGQYDHQSLLNAENHINVLDAYGSENIAETKEQAAAHYERYISAASELSKLKKKLEDAARQKELLAYEISEIDGAAIAADEDKTLAEEISVMQHSEQIYGALSQAYQSLFGDGGASETLGIAMEQLQSVETYSGDIEAYSKIVTDACYNIEDLSRSLRSMRDSVSFSQEELDAKIERQETVESLKRKYGGSLQALFAYRDKALLSLKTIENADAEVSRLEAEISEAKSLYLDCARKLTARRTAAAKLLEERISIELSQLAFHDSRFKVSIKAAPPSPNGSDQVEFLIATNKGAELRPLAKIASGGELSRIMLAMKRIIGQLDAIPTMIFDEIDTGISGATAGVVGEKLVQIADDHQIVCITHLPQIACRGLHHFRITKVSDEISTQTTVVPLTPSQRTEEIARLLSGTNVTEAARLQAKELLGY